MQNYQLTILISNKLDEKAREAVLDSVNKDLGVKAKADTWGLRGLAYPIKHEEKAFYAHYNFESEPHAIPVIDRKLKLNEDIVRYLLIKVDPKEIEAAKKTIKIEKKAEKEEKTEEPKEEVNEEAAVEAEETPEEKA